MKTESISPTLESKRMVEKFFGLELPENLSWNDIMSLVTLIENLDYCDRVTSTYYVTIAKRGSDIQPAIYTGKPWLIRRNVNNNRLSNTWSVIVEFVKRYEEIKWNTSEL